MASFRAFVLAALCAWPLLPATAVIPALAQQVTAPISTTEMMQVTGLDVIFSQFGAAIADSARQEQVTNDERFIARWEATALSSFDSRTMHGRLAKLLDGRFTADEQQVFASFFRSSFGLRISAIERAVAILPAAEQVSAMAEGEILLVAADATRRGQIDEMLELVSAEISGAMVAQSVRAMLMAMSVANQQGDIDVPWAEIDAQVAAMQPTLLAEVEQSQRTLMLYAYRELSEVDLDHYIEFLRTPAAKKFYAIAAYAVGRVVTDGMSAFGEALAQRMKSVNV